ncbi:MAG: cytochrome c maturation protein CcmE [Rickettsiales bacterium]|nr:cytochrome c maturation protein CcmE [Rickettsiales bacterium]
MKAKYKRFFSVSFLMILFSVGCLILFFNLRNNLVFFYSPSEIIDQSFQSNEVIRMGGMVLENSLKKKIILKDNLKIEEISFIVTDLKNNIKVNYIGILPDLFADGKGVVVQGKLNNDLTFLADQVLAKHDENYMPPEVKSMLEKTKELK